jgi:hypothetical protein
VEEAAVGFVEAVASPPKAQEKFLDADLEVQHLQGPYLRHPPHLLGRLGSSDCCLSPREQSFFTGKMDRRVLNRHKRKMLTTILNTRSSW